VRNDFEALHQMPTAFTDADEKGLWKGEAKPISEITHSFSGHERNRLFLSNSGKQFTDVSLLSGMDSEADGRVFAMTDFDRDGDTDIAVVNSNAPFFQFFVNQTGAASKNNSANYFVAVQLVGGNSAAATSNWSNRDGIGARICVTTCDRKIYRSHHCGEGLAAQNSSVHIVGCGQDRSIERVVVDWPSGRKTEVTNVAFGQLLRIYENPDQSPQKSAVVREDYRLKKPINTTRPIRTLTDYKTKLDVSEFSISDSATNECDLVVVTTMASWCQACISHLPQFELLEKEFGHQVALVGFPIDPEDTPDKLTKFQESHDARYNICQPTSPARRKLFVDVLSQHGDPDTLPSTIVTDKTGRVLLIDSGVPSVSQLKSLLLQLNSQSKSR
jgi:thiol-disulfide isomerase/thioredoxin